MYYDTFCKIYIYSNLDYDSIFNKILMYIKGKKNAIDYITTDWCEACLKKNKEYSREYYLANKEDFVYWNYYLDIETPENIEMTDSTYIEKVRDLLTYLKEFCDGVVASCDFEEFL